MNSDSVQQQFNVAWSLRNLGNFPQALAIAEEQLALAREKKDLTAEAMFLKIYAQVHSDKKELREALSCYKKIEHIYIVLKDKARQMHTLRHIGNLYLDLEEFECAEKCLIQVVEAYEANSPAALEMANTHRLYALALGDLNRQTEARIYWQKAKEVYEKLWIPEAVEECEGYLI